MSKRCEACNGLAIRVTLAWADEDIDTLKWIGDACLAEGYYVPFPALLCGPETDTVDEETRNAWKEIIAAAYRLMGEESKDDRQSP